MEERAFKDWLELHLAGVAGLSEVPPTVAAAAADEGRVAAQHDVEDYPKAPQVAALIIDGGFLAEGLHDLRGHVLCRATLRRQRSQGMREEEISAACIPASAGLNLRQAHGLWGGGGGGVKYVRVT